MASMTRTFLDTSFVIALVNDKDEYFQTARDLLPIYQRESLVTTDAVLFEIGNALAKDFKKEALRIIKTLRDAKGTEVVEIDSTLFYEGLSLYEKYQDKKWGLVDCISFVVMTKRGI